MSTVRIGTKENQKAYRPGETIEGAMGWELPEAPAAIEVRLFWQTRGKGTEDVEIVDRVRIERPAEQGALPFRFTAPAEPVSFAGRLVALIWALEVVVLRQGPSARVDLIIAPDGREIVLGSVGTAASSG